MPTYFNILVLPQTGYWIAQCLEVDIMSQGTTREEAEERWLKTFTSHLRVSQKIGVDPFKDIGEAPTEYKDAYAQKTRELEVDVPNGIMDHFPNPTPLRAAFA